MEEWTKAIWLGEFQKRATFTCAVFVHSCQGAWAGMPAEDIPDSQPHLPPTSQYISCLPLYPETHRTVLQVFTCLAFKFLPWIRDFCLVYFLISSPTYYISHLNKCLLSKYTLLLCILPTDLLHAVLGTFFCAIDKTRNLKPLGQGHKGNDISISYWKI